MARRRTFFNEGPGEIRGNHNYNILQEQRVNILQGVFN